MSNLQDLPVSHPNVVVYYDPQERTAILASGTTVPIINFLDVYGEPVPFEDINEHDMLRVEAGPTPDGKVVNFGISKAENSGPRKFN